VRVLANACAISRAGCSAIRLPFAYRALDLVCADTGGMQGFGGSRAPSVGVLPRADSVAASRGGGGGGRLGGQMSRPGTAKLGKFLLLFLSFEPKQTSVRVRLTTVADAQPVLNFAACKRTYPPPLMCAMVRAHK